jgi:hypothetical protein
MNVIHDPNTDTLQVATVRYTRERPNDARVDDAREDDVCTCGGVGYHTHLTWCPAVRY